MKNKEGYVIPELEIRVTPAWVRLIRFCQLNIPHGQLCIKLRDAQPTDLVPEHTKRRIRFDKEEEPLTNFESTQFGLDK